MSLRPTVECDPVTTDLGGGPLTGLAGYRVYYGLAPATPINSVQFNMPCRTVFRLSCPPLTKNVTNYFSVTAFDDSNNESPNSAEVSVFVSGGLVMK